MKSKFLGHALLWSMIIFIPFLSSAQTQKIQIGTSTQNSFAVTSMGRLNSNQWYLSAYLTSSGTSIILNLRQENGSTSNTNGVSIQSNSSNYQILDLVPLGKGKAALIFIQNNKRIMGSVITATSSGSLSRTTPEEIRTTGGNVNRLSAITMTYVSPTGSIPSSLDIVLNYHSTDMREPYLGKIKCYPSGGQYGYFSTLGNYATVRRNGADLAYNNFDQNIGITHWYGAYAVENLTKIERLDNNSFMVMVWSPRITGMVRFEKWDLKSSGSGVVIDYNNVTAHYDENIGTSNYQGAILSTQASGYPNLGSFDMVKNGNYIFYVVSANTSCQNSSGGNFTKSVGGRKNFIIGKIQVDVWGNIINPVNAVTDRGQFTGTWVDANIDGSTSIISPSIVSAGGGTSIRVFYGRVTGSTSNSTLTGRSGFVYLQLPFWSGMQDGPTNLMPNKKTGYAGYLNRVTRHLDSETDYINIFKENTSSNKIFVSF